jgi:hypothetical protein
MSTRNPASPFDQISRLKQARIEMLNAKRKPLDTLGRWLLPVAASRYGEVRQRVVSPELLP